MKKDGRVEAKVRTWKNTCLKVTYMATLFQLIIILQQTLFYHGCPKTFIVSYGAQGQQANKENRDQMEVKRDRQTSLLQAPF